MNHSIVMEGKEGGEDSNHCQQHLRGFNIKKKKKRMMMIMMAIVAKNKDGGYKV